MEIVCKKTTELTAEEKRQICDCFEAVFEGHSKSLSDFNNEFDNTCLGYSFHTMLKSDENIVVGLYAVIPFDYLYNGEKQLFAIGVDFMIRKEFRNDFKNVMGICGESMKFAKANGVTCIFAFPNDLSHQLNTRILRMKDIGKLYTYILPYKVGAAKPKLKVLNICSMLLSWLLLFVSRLDCRKKKYSTLFERDRSTFDNTRYKWFNPMEYRFYHDGEMSCSWKVANFDNVKAAFLMDFYPVSSANFNKSVRIMFNAEKDNVGIFLYVGNLPFVTTSMIKIPLKYAPKNFNFVAQILDKKKVQTEDVYDVNNWDVNLSSYDLI